MFVCLLRHRNVEKESERSARVTYLHDISGIPVNQTRGQPFLTYISRCPTKKSKNMYKHVWLHLFLFIYWSTYWVFEKLIKFVVDLFVGSCFTRSLLGKRMGSNMNYFPKGWAEVQNTYKTTLYFSLYDINSPTSRMQISVWVLAHLNSRWSVTSFLLFFFRASSETLNVVIVVLWLKRIPSK